MADVKKPAAKESEAAVMGVCPAKACKTKPSRFGFCEEHYDQFKFGLIKKNGELVSDHEKKLQHYTEYKSRKKQVA